MKQRLLFVACVACPLFSAGQQKDYSHDVRSVDAIITALYDVISGGPGDARDWTRFRNLFTADARLIPTFRDKEGKTSYRMLTPEDYEKMFVSRINTGFFEKELHRVTEEYGAIVHVFSTYETRQASDGPVTNRGINSIQLLKTAERYYVMNIFWSAETPDNALPSRYLPEQN